MTPTVSCLSVRAVFGIPGHAQRFVAGCVLGLLIAPFGGCALNSYPMFDNSRDWGPSYLIGPPGHHFGYGTRVDDSRTVGPDPALPPQLP
jgi:hypothetical protein